ncbi:arginine repressor [Galliscardovia ingluviei]|uniref:Arginine repressor n=1 Tax=Galliscardovia ingluviei TaxID=1769422 RepID=A0A8J3F1V9_9BIFI|nr:arginine repressor [Galliscardovia ingluviei]GGI13776.1 arginine repressor [Galliscardovia ingluviei]
MVDSSFQRPQTRTARLSVIEEILRNYIITSQAQLQDQLAQEGISVTQATLSRDLDELQAIKIRSAQGSMVYAVPEQSMEATVPQPTNAVEQHALSEEAFDNTLNTHENNNESTVAALESSMQAEHAIRESKLEQQLSRILSGLVTSVVASNNLIVVHTPSGAAQYAASALDRQPLEGVLGTIAGDDTVLIITVNNDVAQERMQWLLSIAQSGNTFNR